MHEVRNKLQIKSTEVKNICCIGAGYVGGPSMAVIAKYCPEIQINVVDINKNRINLWNDKNLNNLPIFEPGLDLIIQEVRGKNLHFSNDVKGSVIKADLIFIAVNTPTKSKGIGAGQASDLRWIESCVREIREYAQGYTIVVEKSTLPVRTAEVIEQILNIKSKNDDKTFSILSNPEFLSEGTAIDDLENPNRVLIGGEDELAIKTLHDIYAKWVPKEKIICTNIWSSELSKLTANAFLAQRISSINSISALCESTGADVREVSRAIGLDSRIGSRFLNSGPGFGGSCFKKDILNLVYLAKFFGLQEVADFWVEVVKLNDWHQHRLSKLITQKLLGTISGKKICILGFAFKANTNDTRESASITICRDLLEEGAFLSINDPKVSKEQIELDLKSKSLTSINYSEKTDFFSLEGQWSFEKDIYKSAHNSDAILILTEWENYLNIDWNKISENMRKPSWVFDARSILNPEEIINNDLHLWRIGDGYNHNKTFLN